MSCSIIKPTIIEFKCGDIKLPQPKIRFYPDGNCYDECHNYLGAGKFIDGVFVLIRPKNDLKTSG